MARYLFNSYLILIVASLLLTDHLRIQRGLSLLWIFSVVVVWLKARQNDVSILHWLRATVISQLPGIIASAGSVWSMRHDGFGEWANGLLELWVTPLMPFLELLPAKSIYTISDVFLAACLVPFSLIVLSIILWTVAGHYMKLSRRFRYR